MTRPQATLFIVAVALWLGGHGVAAVAAPEVPWTPHIARQLVALGWEHPAAPAEQPVVIYSLQFVQLDAAVARGLEMALDTSIGARTEADAWAISFGPDGLRLLEEASGRLTSTTLASSRTEGAGTAQEAWLVTVGEAPIRLALREGSLSGGVSPARAIGITLTPRRIDAAGRRILTDVAFDFTSPTGATNSATTSLWAEFAQPRPVAVMTQAYENEKGRQRRHVAIYIQGTVAPAGKLPAELPLVPIGDVQAFETLFPEEAPVDARSRSSLTVGVHHARGRTGFDVEALLLTEGQNRLLLGLDGASDQVGLAFGVDFRLVQELFLVTRWSLDPSSHPESVVRLGLAEKTRLGPLQLSATVLPVAYGPGQGRVELGTRAAVGVRFVGERWDLFGEADYDGTIEPTLGFTLYSTSGKQGLQLTWTQAPDGSSRVALRITVSW